MNISADLIEKYKPEKIRILLIGEAPGRADKNFYLANTNLYRTIYSAFKELYGDFNSSEDFLQFFKSAGCFLDHLGLETVDRQDVQKRKANRQNGIQALSERIAVYQPETLIILMKAIEKEVQQAVNLADTNSIIRQAVTAYPAGSDTNRLACIRGLIEILKVSVCTEL